MSMNIMSNEYWDLFDSDRILKMKHHRRGDKIPDGLFHLVIHSWIVDKSGLFLMSQRQEGRAYAYMWERTGGSVLEGESSFDGALREVREELGVDLSESEHCFIKTQKRERYHDFFDAWLFIVDREQIKCRIDPNEVRECKWVSIEELASLKADNKLVPSSAYYNEVYSVFKKKITDTKKH